MPKYLSIGDLSKLTGVHIKSLRYYDEIGVLKPAYVAPDTKYRYYTYSQLGIVHAIQTCVELDIPLRRFSEFSEDGGQQIHYARLLDDGKAIAEKKIRAIRDGIRQIDAFQREIARSEVLLKQEKPTCYEVAKKRYYTIPLDKTPDYNEYLDLSANLYYEAVEKGYTMGYESGLLYIYRKETVKRYQFIEILSGRAKAEQMLTLPAGQYLSKCVEQSKIETAPELFPELFFEDKQKVVIESELFIGDYNISKPLYELRCSILEL